MRAACRPSLVCRAAQIAPRREGQKRLDRNTRQGDRIFALDAADRRCLRGGAAREFGESPEIALVEDEAPLVFVMQDVLTEQRVQAGEALGNFGHAYFCAGSSNAP